MQNTRFPSPWLLALVLFGTSLSAGAMGFGAGAPAASLGQPLDFSVALRLEPGEIVEPHCVRAAVKAGELSLPRDAVAARLEPAAPYGPALVRVRTLSPITEPVVEIDVSVGCPEQLTRRFVVFADPPQRLEAALLMVAAADLPQVPADFRQPERRVRSKIAATRAPAPTAIPAAALPKPAKAATRASPPRQLAQTPRPARKVSEKVRPRLQLDPAPPVASESPTPVLSAEALAVVDQANEAVKAAIAAASASQGRMTALEASVQQLRADAVAQRELVQQMRDRAAAAESRSRWILPLLLATLALLALSAWLWLRLRDIEHERQQSWLELARRAPAGRAALAPSPSQVPVLVERNVHSGHTATPGAGLAPAYAPSASELPDTPDAREHARSREDMDKTRPPRAPTDEDRDVSAEELIDLEQQADFFIVLGQDAAAVELLLAHLRDSGGASPLPYLRLLDIYHRLGDRIAYAQIRERFSERFNVRAPAWDDHAQGGRTLEEYPSAIRRLQRAWARPAEAMIELEALMLGHDGGEVFDLSAYRELLLLYALAREVLDASSDRTDDPVDLLLPLKKQVRFDGTTPRPHFGREVSSQGGVLASAAIDLDLSVPSDRSPRSSVF